MRLRRSLVLMAFGVLMISMIGCGGPTDGNSNTPPDLDTVPAGYTTFTDDTNSFSISYPPTWVIDQKRLADLDEQYAGWIDVNGRQVRAVETIFFAGLPDLGEYVAYSTSALIQIELLPTDMTLASYQRWQVDSLKESHPDAKILGRNSLSMNGFPAEYIRYELPAPDFFPEGEVSDGQKLAVLWIDHQIGWVVICEIIDHLSVDATETCQSVIESVRTDF